MSITVLNTSESPNQPLASSQHQCVSAELSLLRAVFSLSHQIILVESVNKPPRLSRLLSFYHQPAPLTQTYAGANSRQIQRKLGR